MMSPDTAHLEVNGRHQGQFLARRRGPKHRVRTGCMTCRGRKKKCDEVKPVCSGCKRNHLDCRWPSATQIRQRAGEARQKSLPPVSKPENSLGADTQEEHSAEEHSAEEHSTATARRDSSSTSSEPNPPSSSPSPPRGINAEDGHLSFYIASPTAPDGGDDDNITAEFLAEESLGMEDEAASGYSSLEPASGLLPLIHTQPFMAQPQTDPPPVPQSMSLHPNLDFRSLELFSYYLSHTSVSMGNGSTEINPFVTQLVPLAFANELILQLVLTQSALHHANTDTSNQIVAQRAYTKSLGLFQQAIGNYVQGRESNPLWVTVGALIMCFTETTRGDAHGVIFDHLSACQPLLAKLVLEPGLCVSPSLRNFIVEYYTYTAVLSMISIDPTNCVANTFLSPDLEVMAQQLADSGYIGHLCGCWLSLLLMIPRIFEFARHARMKHTESPFPDADDMMTFSQLQLEIVAFQPSADASRDVVTCGSIIQQAVYLYLLTSAKQRSRLGGPLRLSIDACLAQAFALLAQLPDTARINTSLCWALAVIGSCTTLDSHRNELRSRLRTMFHKIRLANITGTAAILELVWALPEEEQSPWKIHQVMQDNQMWTSFA